MQLATHTLSQVEASRLQKAVEGYVAGAFTIRVTRSTEEAIEGFVTNGDSVEYSIAITPHRVFCSCRDSMFRHQVCKHATVLALHVIRTPPVQPAQPDRYQLGDRVSLVRDPGWTGKVVCISGDLISVHWDRGGIRPLLASQLTRCEAVAPNLSLGKVRRNFAFSA